MLESFETYEDWNKLNKEIEGFPPRTDRLDDEDNPAPEGWIFRGHKSYKYELSPAIERKENYSGASWSVAEHQALREFKSKAQLHLSSIQLPSNPDDKLAWLALMQHYGAPTRLLDFTYSPYVALYFALRHREESCAFAEVWAINPSALERQLAKRNSEADRAVNEKKHGKKEQWTRKRGFMLNLDGRFPLQKCQAEDELQARWIAMALSPCETRQKQFNENGYVTMANSPIQNHRLSSQQGVFLFNGAVSLKFMASLDLMMAGTEAKWYRRLRIPGGALKEIESKLFSFNIHELSLFPDIEGLSGFIGQRMRLHW